MPSQVEHCNMALSELGIGWSAFVSSISPSDGSKNADVCAMHYTPALEHVLRDIGPRWATKRKVLALIDEEIVTNWAYGYSYPNDCLKVHGIVTAGTRLPRIDESIPYEVANYNDHRVILTDLPNAEIIYTAKVTDTGLWDSMFSTAFVNFLASRMAMPLGHGELANNLLQAYYALAAQAWSASMNESNTGELPAGGFEAARS